MKDIYGNNNCSSVQVHKDGSTSLIRLIIACVGARNSMQITDAFQMYTKVSDLHQVQFSVPTLANLVSS